MIDLAETSIEPIRFGIPSLDVLLGRRASRVYQFDLAQLDDKKYPCGIDVSPREGQTERESVTISIIGSDGTGKSILAMHLAAKYIADRTPPDRKSYQVIYASTDLSYSRATDIWENFELEYPESRIENPFDFDKRELRAAQPLDWVHKRKLNFGRIVPLDQMIPFAQGIKKTSGVQFLDLASNTSGDDWGYLNRLIASLNDPRRAPRHLLLVDTVDDLELMAGERDAHGARRDRRSRIAELIRTAAGKCHLVLVSGDQPKGQAPEEYIADVVIRLGFKHVGGYQRRTVSVEKVRGQSSIRGEHDLTIRSGIGGSTGKQEHFDDPRIVRHQGKVSLDPNSVDPRSCDDMRAGKLDRFELGFKGRFQSYVHVFHSLHYLNNSIMRADGPSVHVDKKRQRFARFGVTHLDDLFDYTTNPPRQPTEPAKQLAERLLGIPTDEPAALIGEDGTHKSALSKAFLSRSLLPARDGVNTLHGDSFSKSSPHGVAILLTTKTLDTESLLLRLNDHLPQHYRFTEANDEKHTEYRSRIICRRLDYHSMTSATLFHTVAQAVRAAQRIIATSNPERKNIARLSKRKKMHSEEIRRSYGWRIRLVIDNWASLREIYPDVHEDPLFLPCLLFYLRREGIATLIVGNEDRGFSEGFELKRCRSLRDLTQLHLYTWHTPFFGHNRVAITVNPPAGRERTDAVRELSILNSSLHVPREDDCKLAVNPSFEMYDGIQRREPKYVQLRVHLYGEGDPTGAYFPDIKALLGELVAGDPSANFARIEPMESYEDLRELSQLQGPTRFPYTLVLQVDEFWAKSGVLHLRRMDRYLLANVAYSQSEPHDGKDECRTHNLVVEDPFDLFQPSQTQISVVEEDVVNTKTIEEWTRTRLLTPPGYSLIEHVTRKKRELPVDRVPYTWDFGFLKCYHDLWDSIPSGSIADAVWNNGLFRLDSDRDSPQRNVSWFDFTKACREVAELANQSTQKCRRFVPFALAREAQESLSCLLLEIWASEVAISRIVPGGPSFDTPRHAKESMFDLGDFASKHKRQLYQALCLLYDLVPHDAIGADNQLVGNVAELGTPVAVRSWYSTAADYQSASNNDWYVPARLPGSYSVRGDWFLAVARGSRSYKMGERAIDLLCSRRANIIRLQAGIGLPVRDNDEKRTGLWTSLWAGNRRTSAKDRVTYDQFVKLGGPATTTDRDGKTKHQSKIRDALGDGTLKWLWRSRINHYDRHARVFRRWVCWILRGKLRDEAKGRSGIDLYPQRVPDWFDSEIKELQKTLSDATIHASKTD